MGELDEDIAWIEAKDNWRSLIAAEDISQGRTICVLPLKTMEKPDKYSVEASPGVHIDCTDSLAGAINHSCDPNAAVRHFRVIAWKCIKAGEEITIDYNRTEYQMAEPFLCYCCGVLIRGSKYVGTD